LRAAGETGSSGDGCDGQALHWRSGSIPQQGTMELQPGQFAARLRELRRAAGLTQGELAKRAGLSRNGVSQLEQAVRDPSFATVAALAEALGTDCKAFLQPAAKQPKPKPGRPKNPKPQ